MGDDRFRAAASRQGRPRGACVGGYIEIDAPANVVWSIVGNWQGWGDWNPLYTSTSGEPRVGNMVDMTIAIPGMKATNARATVLTYRPDSCFEYGLSNMGGLLRAFRFVDVEEIAPGKCGVANGEIMSGPVGRLVARLVGPKVSQGLLAMNDRLKGLAEAEVREQRVS